MLPRKNDGHAAGAPRDVAGAEARLLRGTAIAAGVLSDCRYLRRCRMRCWRCG